MLDQVRHCQVSHRRRRRRRRHEIATDAAGRILDMKTGIPTNHLNKIRRPGQHLGAVPGIRKHPGRTDGMQCVMQCVMRSANGRAA